MRVILLPLLLLLATSCGYRLGSGDLASCYRTLSVPYIQCDTTGLFTAALIKEVATSSPFQYVNGNADLCLSIQLLGFREENVGFRYDIDKQGNLTNWLVPTETRVWAAAEVTVIDNAAGCAVLGPVRLSTYVDFDHEYYLSQNGVNVFSLGQLTDIREGREAANTPLSQALAKKIIDYISNAW